MATASSHYITTAGSIEITIALPEHPPFEVDAIVEEQDTCLLLGVEPEIRYPDEDYNSLVNHMLVQQPLSPGNIIVKKTTPLRFFAIVHDIEQKPTWRKEWIAMALEQLFHETERFKVKTLALPLLGTIHGSMNDEDLIKLLLTTLPTGQLHSLKRIWLVAPASVCDRVRNFIDDCL